jgi:HAD superfamily hydrolase (TIGR01509 family)
VTRGVALVEAQRHRRAAVVAIEVGVPLVAIHLGKVRASGVVDASQLAISDQAGRAQEKPNRPVRQPLDDATGELTADRHARNRKLRARRLLLDKANDPVEESVEVLDLGALISSRAHSGQVRIDPPPALPSRERRLEVGNLQPLIELPAMEKEDGPTFAKGLDSFARALSHAVVMPITVPFYSLGRWGTGSDATCEEGVVGVTMRSSALAFQAAVFDCDGTLVETGELWLSAYRKVTGEAIPHALRANLAGASTDQAAQHLEAHFGRRFDPDAIEDALMDAASGCALEPLEGAEELLRFLFGAGLPLAIATNGPRNFVQAVLGERLLQYFAFVLPSEELEPRAHKPQPDVYEHACRRLGVSTTSSVAFEDAEVGAKAANAAQLSLVFVNALLDQPPPGISYDIFVRSLNDEDVYLLLRGGQSEY